MLRRPLSGSKPDRFALIVRVIGYITTFYPGISHTFILREVKALRRLGLTITTTSVRRTPPDRLLAADDREEAKSTHNLLPARWVLFLRAHARALLRHPAGYVSSLAVALGMGRPGARGRLWQVFYFVESVAAWDHWRRLGVRHVHAHHAAVPADIALLAAHLGRRAGHGPTSWSFTLHGPAEFFDMRWFALAEKTRRADRVVCISDFARSQLMALVDEAHWDKLRVVHCGIEVDRYASVPNALSERSRVVCVGRLVPEKGQALLVRAVAALAALGHDVELELVGDGPQRRALERLVGELELTGRVHFTGAVAQEQVDTHVSAATVFCLASFAEGVPVVLMEAMACRRPVVATSVAGVTELVRDGQTGIIVSPGRVDQLANALAGLLSDQALRHRLGDAGRAHVAACYDVDKSAQQLRAVFRELGVGTDPFRGEEPGVRARPSEQADSRPMAATS